MFVGNPHLIVGCDSLMPVNRKRTSKIRIRRRIQNGKENRSQDENVIRDLQEPLDGLFIIENNNDPNRDPR